MDWSPLRPVCSISRLPTRVLQGTLAVQLQRRVGRPLLQPGPELLHQQQALPQRSHLLQHRPGVLHLQLPAWLHRNKLRNENHQRMFSSALSQWWNLPSKFLFRIFSFLFFFLQNKLTDMTKTLCQSAKIFFSLPIKKLTEEVAHFLGPFFCLFHCHRNITRFHLSFF